MNETRYYVMKRNNSYATGFEVVGHDLTYRQAVKRAKARDTLINGRPAGLCRILDSIEYQKWHDENVMPYYREPENEK